MKADSFHVLTTRLLLLHLFVHLHNQTRCITHSYQVCIKFFLIIQTNMLRVVGQLNVTFQSFTSVMETTGAMGHYIPAKPVPALTIINKLIWKNMTVRCCSI